MSQKKVDIYKEQKKNRQSIIKKEKRMLMIEKIIGALVCVVLVVWMGFSLQKKVTVEKPAEVKETMINVDSLSDYMNGLNADVDVAEAE